MLRMRILLVCFVMTSLLPRSSEAQVSYNDVAVIVNTNSSASITIGTYFKSQRNIPSTNVIYVHVDTTEEIDSTMFNVLRSQVEDQLILNNLRDSINYLVTTKGVPLKVNRGSTFSMTSPSASVESELMLVLGTYARYIGGESAQISPYFNRNANFTRAAYGIYLVTRLDAYTVQDVLDLIDRSGPDLSASSSAPFLFDQDPAWSSPLNAYMTSARTTLANKGKAVIYDSSSTYLTGKQNLLGYMSWGSNDHYQHQYTAYAIPHNTYAPGAIVETYVSTSGRTFNTPPVYGQSLIVDLLAEGASGAKGYVYEPYSNAMAIAYLLFDRYTSHYNLAESYFMASYLVSWMDVVVGDPKTSINYSLTPTPVQWASFTASIVPQANAITFNWRTISETNNYGFFVQQAPHGGTSYTDIVNSFVPGHGTTLLPQDYSWTYASAPSGTFSFRLRQVDLDGTEHFSEPIIVTNGVISRIDESIVPEEFSLAQNYPNPFNPSTEIEFTVDATDRAGLEVYNATGQKVATLFDGIVEAGRRQKVRFDAGGLSSGVYFYRLHSGGKSQLRKMMLVK